MTTIFDLSTTARRAFAQRIEHDANEALDDLPEGLLRQHAPGLPEVSELQAVRHYTKLSQKNFSIDTQFYPLGSCTMKYNPRGAHKAANLPGFLERHPLAPESVSQGVFVLSVRPARNFTRRHGHARGLAHTHGRRPGRICRCGDDSCLS